MIDPTQAFHGFSVPDIEAARAFYADVLGVDVTAENDMLQLHVGGGAPTLVYPKPDHEPASFTILNFPVARRGGGRRRADRQGRDVREVRRHRRSRPTRRACSAAAAR